MNQERIFLCNGVYVRLNAGALTPMSSDEVKLFCGANRGTQILFFQQGTEAFPDVFISDARLKKINLQDNALNELLGSYDRELNGVFDLVMAWVASTTLVEIRHISAMVKERRA